MEIYLLLLIPQSKFLFACLQYDFSNFLMRGAKEVSKSPRKATEQIWEPVT